MHIGDALGEQCTRLLQGMLAVSAHKDMPPGFLLLPFLEPAAGTGTFAALKGRLRKAKDTLLSKAFKRWAVVFFCQHEGCDDPLGAHPASAFELREPTETLRKLAPYLQALSTLVKVGAAAGKLLQLPLPSRIPFVSDAVDAATGAAALSRSELGDLYDSVGAELGLEASAGEAAAGVGGAAEATVAAAGQKEQEAAYQAVKAALDNKRVGKEGSDWRREHGLQLCTVVQQQLWCCKTCAAQLHAGGGASAVRPSFAAASPRNSNSRKCTDGGSATLWSGVVLRLISTTGKWKKRECQVTERAVVFLDAKSGSEHAIVPGLAGEGELSVEDNPQSQSQLGKKSEKDHMLAVMVEGQQPVVLATQSAAEKAQLVAALRTLSASADSSDDDF